METSASSLYGLKLKRMLYFEDVTAADGGGEGSYFKASASAAPPALAAAVPPRKRKGVVTQGQQPPPPPRCQVEGCSVDLTGAKAYYCRHKVCGMHSKSPKVVVAGMEQRFCQQCSRFHQLHEFDLGKRSCRRRLACHNERRRKPPPRPLSSHIGGHLSSAFHEDNIRFRGFLVDFAHPELSAQVQDGWQIGRASDLVPSFQYQSGLVAPSARAVSHAAYPYVQDPVYEHTLSAPGATGDSDSSCALSLLSTHPWDSTSKVNHRAISARCSFDGTPIAELVNRNDSITSSWGRRGLEVCSSSTLPEVRSSQVGQPDNNHFTGELELALLGKRQCVGHDPSRRYRHSDDTIHWSL